MISGRFFIVTQVPYKPTAIFPAIAAIRTSRWAEIPQRRAALRSGIIIYLLSGNAHVIIKDYLRVTEAGACGKPEKGDYAPLANNTYSLTAFTCWPPTEEFPPTARWARSIFSHYTRSELSSNPTNAHIFFTNPLIVRNSWRIPVCLDSERGDISCGNGNQLILKRFDT